MQRCFCRAKGKVQGVGFRVFVQQQASELAITGWVHNEDDGTVTMELQGEEHELERLKNRIRLGNFFIRVDDFAEEEREVLAEETGFKIRY